MLFDLLLSRFVITCSQHGHHMLGVLMLSAAYGTLCINDPVPLFVRVGCDPGAGFLVSFHICVFFKSKY